MRGALIRAAVFGVILLAAAGAGAWWTHSHWRPKYDKLANEYAQFKGGVQALGEDARRRVGMQMAADLRNKDRADEENRKRIAALTADVRRLRAESDATRGRFLSAIAAATGRADEAEKFRAKFERAYRELVQEIRAVGDDGDAAVVDLDTAKEWAHGR